MLKAPHSSYTGTRLFILHLLSVLSHFSENVLHLLLGTKMIKMSVFIHVPHSDEDGRERWSSQSGVRCDDEEGRLKTLLPFVTFTQLVGRCGPVGGFASVTS